MDTYRFIGGSQDGKARTVIGASAEFRIASCYASREQYERRTIRVVEGNFTVTETLFVLRGMSELEAQTRLIGLGFPKINLVRPVMVEIEDSSWIRGIGYDQAVSALDVLSETGETYRYYGVSSQLAWQFISAESKGQFYNRFIKSQFTGVLVTV